jgi:type III secretion protein D
MTQHRAAPADLAAVLRLCAGRLSGKEYPLARDRRICIGHGLGNDVVLRGAGCQGIAVELRPGDGSAALRVLSGQIELLGRTLGEGEEAVLPPYLPFRIGEHLIAHGDSGSPRWTDAADMATGPCAAPVVPLPAPKLADRAQAMGRSALTRIVERISVMHVAVTSAAVMLVAAAAGPTGAFIEEQFGGPAALQSAYREAGLRALEVTRNPSGGLIVAGAVEDEGDIARVRQIAAQAYAPVMIDVTSSASLANAATDILTAQGIDARAVPAGLGGVAVEAPYLPADKQDELRKLLSSDLPGLRRVSFRVDDSRGGNPLQTLFASSGSGLATVVEDPGHIVTADGSRWFPGAVLPTGHRLVAVEAGVVRFEKDGRVEELRL